MRIVPLLLALALPAPAAEMGGHDLPPTAAEQAATDAPDDRRAILEEMWQRRLLPPDQQSWSPLDAELLDKIRRHERDALLYLRRKPGGTRPWTARGVGANAPARLTKEGFERYWFLLTQDAVAYFEGKGADAKRVFKLKDWDGRALFDGSGKLTEDGERVYQRARLKLEVYWKTPEGQAFGTRRPPTNKP